MLTTDDHLLSLARRLSSVLSYAVFGLGLWGLVGWKFFAPYLGSRTIKLVVMAPVACVLYMLIGAALWALQEKRSGRFNLTGRALAGSALVLSALTLMDYFLNFNLGLETAVLKILNVENVQPVIFGTVITAMIGIFVIAAAIMLLLGRRTALHATAHVAATIAGMLGLASLIGYLYDFSPLYFSIESQWVVALPSAIALVCASLGTLLLRPECGLAPLFLNSGISGTAARRFLLFSIAVPFVVGALIAYARRITDIPAEESILLFAVAVILLSFIMVYGNSRALTMTEKAQRDSQQRYTRLFNAKIYGIAHCRMITDENGKPVNYEILKVNDTYLRFIDIKREDIEGKLATDAFTGIENMPTGYIQKYGKIALEGGEVIFEDIVPATNQWLEVYAYQPKQGEFAAIFTDITERKKAEAALRENEVRLKAIVDNLAEGLVVVNPKGGILSWNPAALRMHGYEHHESELDFLSKISEYFELTTLDGKYIPFEQWPINRMLRGEHFRDYTIYVRNRKQGWRRIFSYNGTLIRRDDGTPFMGLISIRDVTESKKAEEALRRREEELRTITNNSPDVIARFDRQLRHTFINPYGEKVYGKARDEIIGKTNAELGMPTAQAAFWKRHFELVFATSKQQAVEFAFDSPTFGHQYFLSAFVPELDEKEEVQSILAISRDITQLNEVQKHLSDAVREAKRRADEAEEGRRILDALMANIPEGIMITDAAGKILRISGFLSRITGKSESEVAGKPLTVIDKKLGEPAGTERRRSGRGGDEEKTATAVAEKPPEYPLQRALERGEVTTLEERQAYLPDGTAITVLLNAAPVRDEQGKIIGAVATWRDITDRKKAEEAMQAANRELEQFAYVASHDLQEPLRMVASFTELIERRYRGQFDERGQKYMHYIVDGAQRMQNLIQDLLTFSRIGRLDTERHRVDLNKAADGVIADLAATIAETHAAVTHDPLPSIIANESSMGRLFMNLVSNALKFRKTNVPPKVHISAERRSGEWRFAVSDNGIGIDTKYFEKIFVIFQRLHGREEYPGTGMGLAICKKIVENYGGRIWVESEPGKGTTFNFTIPQ